MGRYTPEPFPRVGEPALQEYLYREYLRISATFEDIPEDIAASLAALTAAIALKADQSALTITNGNVAANTANIASNTSAIALKAPIASPTFTGLVTTAGQIKFPATANPSSDVNTLDDYEEGTWTPVITASTGTFTSVSAVGTYTIIGRMVFIIISVTITTVGTAAGFAVATLPFTANTSRQVLPGRSVTAGKMLQGSIPSGGSNVINIVNYDATNPIAAGEVLLITGGYFL